MAQLLVRNIPDEVKERLVRRAEARGRSLEAEVRDILAEASTELLEPATGADLVKQLAANARKSGITDADVDELERLIAEGRKHWPTRPIEFD